MLSTHKDNIHTVQELHKRQQQQQKKQCTINITNTNKLQKTYNMTKVTIKKNDEEQTEMQFNLTTVRCGHE